MVICEYAMVLIVSVHIVGLKINGRNQVQFRFLCLYLLGDSYNFKSTI